LAQEAALKATALSVKRSAKKCLAPLQGEALRQRYPDRQVYLVPEHNDLLMTVIE
jgi:hypothetical protein